MEEPTMKQFSFHLAACLLQPHVMMWHPIQYLGVILDQILLNELLGMFVWIVDNQQGAPSLDV
jgi:hypothetical protein